MKAIFIADAHLKHAKDRTHGALMLFLGRLKADGQEGGRRRDADGREDTDAIFVTDLFLVGDMFDFWFSRGERIYPAFREVVDRLKYLKEQGVVIHLCEGNHDFFLREYFSEHLGMNVYEDWTVIERNGRRIMVGHGDLVDQTNTRYLRLRKFLRSRLVFRMQRLLPLNMLWTIARWSSSVSKEVMNGAEERIAEAMRLFSREKFHEGIDAVILGHCHRPQLLDQVVGGKRKVLCTLGDWVRHDAYLYFNEGEFFLRTFAK